jgi:hypothetical protein
MWLRTITFALLVTVSAAVAHPGPRVWIGNDDGRITTYTSDNDLSPTLYSPSRLFTGTLDEFLPGTNVFTTDFPGYEVKTVDGGVSPGTHFSFAIPGPLLAYDHATASYLTTRALFGSPGPAPQMAVSEGNAVVNTGDGPVDGFDFFTFSTPGDHAHMFYTLYGDGATASSGPDAVYALPLQLRSGALAPSETYYLLLGKGYEQGSPLFDEAADVARRTLVGRLKGDVNLDGRVNAFDLLEVRRHLGGHDEPWDVTGDGRVNVFDLGLVREEMRRAVSTGAVASVVPEPSSLALLAAAGAWGLRRRR